MHQRIQYRDMRGATQPHIRDSSYSHSYPWLLSTPLPRCRPPSRTHILRFMLLLTLLSYLLLLVRFLITLFYFPLPQYPYLDSHFYRLASSFFSFVFLPLHIFTLPLFFPFPYLFSSPFPSFCSIPTLTSSLYFCFVFLIVSLIVLLYIITPSNLSSFPSISLAPPLTSTYLLHLLFFALTLTPP